LGSLVTSPQIATLAAALGSPNGDNAAGFCFQFVTLLAAPVGPTSLTVDDVQIAASALCAGLLQWRRGRALLPALAALSAQVAPLWAPPPPP
jgi:hypothetical protein